jgi:hypothetical protein
MRARRATVRDGRRRTLRCLAATREPGMALQSGVSATRNLSHPRKVPASAPFLTLEEIPRHAGTEGVVQREGRIRMAAVGMAALGSSRSARSTTRPSRPGRPAPHRHRRPCAPSNLPPPGRPMSRSTHPPVGRDGGPPPGPAFGTSSVSPPVSGAGPAAASQNICANDRTEQTENAHTQTHRSRDPERGKSMRREPKLWAARDEMAESRPGRWQPLTGSGTDDG